MPQSPKDELVQRVRKNVRQLRHERGLTQEKLAERTGISRTYIGYLEADGKNVTLKVLAKLARALDVDPHELLKPADER